MNKIAIGTVQFGTDYGISNNNGQTTQHDVKKIFELAKKNNINTIDTAPLYGESESVIGSLIDKSYRWEVVTKTPVFDNKLIKHDNVVQLEDSFYQSLLNLNVDSVYGLLVHSCDDLIKYNGNLIFKSMERLKSKGVVKKIGVSVYNSKQIEYVLKNFKVDIIQIPINIFDQHLFLDGWIDKLKDNNVEIHARSVFLQGLLLMSIDLIPTYFLPIKDKITKFYKMADNLSLSGVELALSYVMSIKGIDKVVVGIDNLQHLHEILNSKLIQINTNNFSDLSINNPLYTNPTNWEI